MTEKPFDLSDIYEQYYSKILNYLTRFVGEQEAEDVAQTVFEKISQNLNSFKGESKLSTWLYRIATNTALDKLRSSSFKYSHSGPHAPLSIDTQETEAIVSNNSSSQNSPDQKIIHDEMNKCIRGFVDKLPPDYRTIIILNELEDFPNKQIAEALQISLDNVKIRLHRAKAKLKKSLESGCDFYCDERGELACDRK